MAKILIQFCVNSSIFPLNNKFFAKIKVSENPFMCVAAKWLKNKAKRSAKQQRSDLVIVFLVQCSQCSVDQTGRPKRKELQCSVVNSGRAL